MLAILLLFCFAEDPGAARLQVEKLDIRDQTPAAKDLTNIRRIYVDVLTGGEAAAQFRDLLIASLQKTKLFILTENEDRADAVMKGAADDKAFTDKFHSSDSLNLHTQVGESNRSSSSRYYYEGESHNAGIGVAESETTSIEERRHEAFAALRLVNRDGDVIWSVTQESLGGKFLGARADVAEKVARQLTADYHRLQSPPQERQKGAPAPVR